MYIMTELTQNLSITANVADSLLKENKTFQLDHRENVITFSQFRVVSLWNAFLSLGYIVLFSLGKKT